MRRTRSTTESSRPSPVKKLVVMTVVAGAGALALWLAGSLLYGMANPFFKQAAVSREERALAQQVTERKAERDALREQIALARSPQGAEQLARRRGFIGGNEHAFRFEVTHQPGAAPVTAPTASTPLTVNTFWLTLIGAFLLGSGVLFMRWRNRRRHQVDGMLTPRSELRKRRGRFPQSPTVQKEG